MVAQPARRLGASAGFTYVSVIVLVAIVAMAGAAALKLGSVLQRSRLEAELLAIGAEYADALQSYADATPAGQPTQPRSFKELLRDPRSTVLKRHLRRIYVDPLTGSAEWGIVYAGDKVGIVAIYSLSDAKAVKIGNFPERFRAFEGRAKVSDWKFIAGGKPVANPAAIVSQSSVNAAPVAPLSPAAPAEPAAPAPDAAVPETEAQQVPQVPQDAPPSEKPASQPDEPPAQEPPDPSRDVDSATPPVKR